MQGLFITGRPTANVEVRYVGDNKTAFARFSVAHNATYKGKTTTDFFEIAVWGALAEWAGKYVKKGKRIVVKSDRFGFDNFTDKDGNKRKAFVITAASIDFADSKDESDAPEAPAAPTDDDCPPEA